MASLRILPNSKYWIACFRGEDGARRQRSTKVRRDGGIASRRLAQKVADSYEDAYMRKQSSKHVQGVIRDLHEQITGHAVPSMSTRDYFAIWLRRRKGEVLASTHAFYSKKLDAYLEHVGPAADDPLNLVESESISRFRDAESERVTNATANHALKCLRMVFGSARKDGHISHNPAEDVAVLKRRSTASPRRAFTVDELKRILEETDDEWRSLVYFGLYTGQRLGDLARLSWRQICLESNEVRITTSKTGRNQIIPIASPLLRHLKALPTPIDQDQPVHPRAFGIIDSQGKSGTLSRQFYDLMAKAGVVEKKKHRVEASEGKRDGKRETSAISFHALRHTATSLMKNAGISPAIVEEFIGHDSAEMNRVYTHIETESLRKAANALPDLDSKA